MPKDFQKIFMIKTKFHLNFVLYIMANLKPFSIEILHSNGSSQYKIVLAYNACHAVNLVYRYLDSVGLLNKSRHGQVTEFEDYLSPNSFKDGQK